jgi:hypothetical protein
VAQEEQQVSVEQRLRREHQAQQLSAELEEHQV